MNGEKEFTIKEAAIIKQLLATIRKSDREIQKLIRNELRLVHRFYISDFTTSRKGFTPNDFEGLVKSKVITIKI
jgi:hypothetical protein